MTCCVVCRDDLNLCQDSFCRCHWYESKEDYGEKAQDMLKELNIDKEEK